MLPLLRNKESRRSERALAVLQTLGTLNFFFMHVAVAQVIQRATVPI